MRLRTKSAGGGKGVGGGGGLAQHFKMIMSDLHAKQCKLSLYLLQSSHLPCLVHVLKCFCFKSSRAANRYIFHHGKDVCVFMWMPVFVCVYDWVYRMCFPSQSGSNKLLFSPVSYILPIWPKRWFVYL